MEKTTNKNAHSVTVARPPVVAVLGHIDHGKSTLLDYIRKTNVVDSEAGGITQHLGAYEVTHTGKDGTKHSITFLDTPGHEAFKGVRTRGANAADIGILVVSAEEGVKPQTMEALNSIKQSGIPYVVALTKIDKPQANLERAKQSLAEHGIYLEGYGGDVPFTAVSAKTGVGIDELLDLVLLLAEMHEIHSIPDAALSAFVIESDMDSRKGISATLIVKKGSIKRGVFIVAEHAYSQCRRLENFLGKAIEQAEAGKPVRIVGWSSVPRVGAPCSIALTKRDAEAMILSFNEAKRKPKAAASKPEESVSLPLIIKADTGGSLEAIEQEAKKQSTDKVSVRIVSRGIGPVSESDLKTAVGTDKPVIVGFSVFVDAPAKSIIERGGFTVATFDVIYKLGEWVAEEVKKRTPKITVQTITGTARIQKIFTTEKDRQVIGGKVLDGELTTGIEFKVVRRDAEIGTGKVRELQRFKEKVPTVPEGSEFGAYVSTSVEIMPNDRLDALSVAEQ